MFEGSKVVSRNFIFNNKIIYITIYNINNYGWQGEGVEREGA